MSSETDISAYSRSILETVGLPLLALDLQLTVEVANDAFLSQFQMTREETVGRPVYELCDGQWDIPELRRLLEQIVERDSTIEDYRVEHVFERVGRRILRLNAKRIRRPDEKECILLAISDESECERLRDELEGRIEFSEKLIDSVREALLILHRGPHGSLGKSAVLSNLRGRPQGDGRAPHLRAGRWPVGHSGTATAA